MISKNECLTLLLKLEEQGLDINKYMRATAVAKEPPLEVLRFIAGNKGFEAISFYEMLRKKSNQKKSPLYKDILKGNFVGSDCITTLSCLLTQVVLFSSKITEETDKQRFLKEARAAEIAHALRSYFTEQNCELSLKLLGLIATDIKVLEFLQDRRQLDVESIS